MAKATEKFKSVTREVKVLEKVSVPDGVTLELTNEEANFLSFILGRLGGNPDHSARAIGEAINNALAHAEYRGSRYLSKEGITDNYSNRAIYFLKDTRDIFKGDYDG